MHKSKCNHICASCKHAVNQFAYLVRIINRAVQDVFSKKGNYLVHFKRKIFYLIKLFVIIIRNVIFVDMWLMCFENRGSSSLLITGCRDPGLSAECVCLCL